jgi:autotransporter-associated beta strand protein
MNRTSQKLAILSAILAGVQSVRATTLLEETFQIPAADNSGAGYNPQDFPTGSITNWYGFGDDGGNIYGYSQYPANPSFYEAQVGPWGQGYPAGFTSTTPASSNPSTLDPAPPTLPGLVYWAGITSDVFGFTTKAGVGGANINSSTVGSISFQVNTYDTSDFLSAAVQIGGNWYYSQATVESATNLGFNNDTWQTDVFNVSSPQWAKLNVTLGNDSGGSAALPTLTFGALPAGKITGLGWFESQKSGVGTAGATGYSLSDYVLNTTAPTLTWSNAGFFPGNGYTADGTTWDIANNFNFNGGGPTVYEDGENVAFTDANNATAHGGTNPNAYNVTLNSVIAPGSIVVNNSTGNYTINGTGTIGGTGALFKSGTATLTLSTANTYSGGTTVSAGVLRILPTSSTTSALPHGALTISGSGAVQLASNVTLGSQTSPTPASNVNLSSLSISGNGTLDIGNNHIIIDYAAGHDPIASIAAWIKSGFNTGLWNGMGITSSSAAANAAYGIAYADAADPGNPAGLASGQIEIMYTLLGDANLDGKVNGADFAILATNFNKAVTGSSGWDQGDFNYDGKINGADFASLAGNFNKGASGAADTNAIDAFAQANGLPLTSSVPEPTSIGLLLSAGLSILGGRRRSTEKP